MRVVGIIGAVLSMALAATGIAAADTAPAESFAKLPAAISARLSPDGTRVALVSSFEGAHVLYIHSIVEGGKNSKIIRTGDFQVRWVRWKDDQHLIAGVIRTTDMLFRHSIPSESAVTRLITFNSDGEDIKMIGEPQGGFALKDENVTGNLAQHQTVHPQIQDEIVSMMPQTSGQILQQVFDKVVYIGGRIAPALYTIDIETGQARWLIDQKYADPSRICIVGGSYGGYAALMGVIREPDLYRCAAAWAPVTDLVKLQRDIKNGLHTEVSLDRLGDDDDRLDAASPARHADRIKSPVLLMHGNQDFTVQPDHSQIMEAALKHAGKPVEAIYLDNADHYRQRHDARLAWLAALDRFLTPQLGSQAAAR